MHMMELDKQKAVSPVSKTENQSSPHPAPSRSNLENPLKTFYDNKVKQIQQMVESNKNEAIYDYLRPTATIEKVDDSSVTGSVSNTTAKIPNVNTSYKPNSSTNSYSIDHILSTGPKNDNTSMLAHIGPNENTKTTPINPINPHNEIGNNTQLPSLELSSHKEPLKMYQPPLMYLPKNMNVCGGPDCLDNNNPTICVGGGVGSMSGTPIHSSNSALPNNTSGNIATGDSLVTIDQSLPYPIPTLHSYHQPATSDIKNGVFNPMQSLVGGPSSNNFPIIGQSHKVASSFHQMKLPSNALIGTTANEEPNTSAHLNESMSLLPESLPIEDQFKPMDYGFKRKISRSKYGYETKVLKKFVVYAVPEAIGDYELRSKREVSRFLKNQPEGFNFQLIPENFNFDNTIHFNMDTRTIGKVPRLKKNSKTSDSLIEKPGPSTSHDLGHQSISGGPESYSVGEFDDGLTNSYLSNNGDEVFLNQSNNTEALDNSQQTAIATMVTSGHPPQLVITKKRGRPKGATSKTPSKAKRMKFNETPNDDQSNLSAGGSGKNKKSISMGNGSISLLKSKSKRVGKTSNSKERVVNGPGNKYVKMPKQAFDDETIDQPNHIPMFSDLQIDNLICAARESMSEAEACATMSNLASVFEFVQEFYQLFPLENRLSVLPSFGSVIQDIFAITLTTTNNDSDNFDKCDDVGECDVLDLVNSPFLCLCECLLETYLNQKLPLPSACYDMKIEFDVSQRFNSINMLTIIRLFVEDYLESIAHLKFASSLSYNRDLKALVHALKSNPSPLKLSPLLKSTVLLFLNNTLTKTPCILNNLDVISNDFQAIKGAKWNVESFIRKLKRHMTLLARKQNASTQANEGENVTANQNNQTEGHLIVTEPVAIGEPQSGSPQLEITANSSHIATVEQQSGSPQLEITANSSHIATVDQQSESPQLATTINSSNFVTVEQQSESPQLETTTNSSHIATAEQQSESPQLETTTNSSHIATAEQQSESPLGETADNPPNGGNNDENAEATAEGPPNNANVDVEDQDENSAAYDEDNEIDDEEDDDDDHNSSRRNNRNKNSIQNNHNVVSVSDPLLLEAVKFDANTTPLPKTMEECKQLSDYLDNIQKVLKDWWYAFFRRFKGPFIGQDRFSRFYSILYHSSCVFVEHNPGELELDNFLNSKSPASPEPHQNDNPITHITCDSITEQNNTINKDTLATDVKQEHIPLAHPFADPSVATEHRNDEDIKLELDNDDNKDSVSLTTQQTNGFTRLMLIENMNDFRALLKSLNNLGMRERMLSKNLNRNIKNMSDDALSPSKFYRDLSSSFNSDETFYVVQSSPWVQKNYGVTVNRIVHLQYNQFVDFIRKKNVFDDHELETIDLSTDLKSKDFVPVFKSKLAQLINMLDARGLIALVKKAKTNSREAKNRYIKSLIDFIESCGDACYDLELVLTSLQLNVSLEPASSNVNNNNNNNKNGSNIPQPPPLVSPIHNKFCYKCHLNVNFDSVISCMYCHKSHHLYCQGFQEDLSLVDQKTWSCNHCKSLICLNAQENSFTICRECNTSTFQNPPKQMIECELQSDNEDDLAVDTKIDNMNESVNENEIEDENVMEPIRCSLCLYYHHRQCVDMMSALQSSANDLYICPSCCEACRTSKTVVESGRKRISKKFKMDICEMFTPCHVLLHELYDHPNAEEFTKPVDLEKYPLYLQVIRKPIDLHQIDLKLKALEYKDRDEFVADVRLIFENCRRFNQSESEIYIACKSMSSFFEERWEQLLENCCDTNVTQQ